jgi:hypothetical protein
MASWQGNYDSAANTPYWVAQSVNKEPTTAEAQALYGNTTSNVYFAGATVGVFGVDDIEALVNGNTGTGWVLRTEGSGGRAGRVTEEVLSVVASFRSDNSADDGIYPGVVIEITEQPEDVTVLDGDTASFTVDYTLNTGEGVIVWQVSTDNGNTWSTIEGDNNFDIEIESTEDEYVDGNQFRAIVSALGESVTSNVATLTISV